MANKPIGIIVVTVLYALSGALGILAGLFAFLGGAAMISALAGSVGGGGFFGALAGAIGIVALIAGAFSLVIAWGIWKAAGWARIIATIFAALGVLSILGFNIIGAAIGALEIYLLWFHAETKAAFK